MVNMNLGLVCLTSDKKISFKTVTKKAFDQLTPEGQKTKLRAIYSKNIETLEYAFRYCHSQGIKLYRMSSAMFPFADTELGRDILIEYVEEFEKIGGLIKEFGIRAIAHPDQFVVLSSPDATVVENSIRILEHHADVFDLLGLEASEWNIMNIHGGGKYSEERFEALVANINRLSPRVRDRLTLENCEYGWSTEELAKVSALTGVPVLFDSHHALVHKHRELAPKLKKGQKYTTEQLIAQTKLVIHLYNHEDIESEFAIARSTWKNPEHQICHISNGKDEENRFDREHHDYISFFPHHLKSCNWVEVEAKAKEQAIFKLREIM